MLDSREVELERWSKVKTSRELMMHGVERSVDGGDSFNIMIFWADPVIRSKFPGLALVFNMVYGAVSHEATSESTFSGAGRAFNKARTLIGSTTLRDSIWSLPGRSATRRRPRRCALLTGTAASAGASTSTTSPLPPPFLPPL